MSFCLFVLVFFVGGGRMDSKSMEGREWEGSNAAPSPESQPLCPPPLGPAGGKTQHNPAIVCLEKAAASYCNYL